MNKALTLLTIAGIAIASPAFAATEVQNDRHDIQKDLDAIAKDDLALQKDREDLRKYRAAKAADKANGDTAKQAADSTRLGAIHTAIAEKKLERKADREILDRDEKELDEDKMDQ